MRKSEFDTQQTQSNVTERVFFPGLGGTDGVAEAALQSARLRGIALGIVGMTDAPATSQPLISTVDLWSRRWRRAKPAGRLTA
jgi:hypothetical protein